MGLTNQKPGVPSRPFDDLTAADIMESDVQFGHRRTKADELASMMIQGAFGSLPILDDDRRLVGIVTEFDLLSALDGGRKLTIRHSGTELSQVSAEDIMTEEPVHVTPETDVLTLVYVLQRNHLIRVPVVDQEGRLVGIVARRDVLRGYMSAGPRPQASPS